MIELHLLRYALAAAETGSFSQAADRFRVKQSTLSKRIRHLELRLGLPIFTRSTQGVSPTAGGARFLARASAIVGDLDRLSAESREIARGRIGCLRIGFQGTLDCGLRTLLADYRDAAPGIDLEAVEGVREELIDAIDRDRLDLALIAGGTCPAQHSLYLWSVPLLIGMPMGHPLLEREPLYWTDLRDMTFLVTRSGNGDLIAAIIASRLTGPNHHPRVMPQAVARDNLSALVDGDRIAAIAGHTQSSDQGIVFREVHDAFGPTRLDQNLHWRACNANPALPPFLDMVTSRFGG